MRRSQIKKDAHKLEEWIEVRGGLKHARSPSLSVGGMYRQKRTTQFGDAVCYRGTERLGVLLAGIDTLPGTVLDQWDLNPTAFGAVLPIYSRPYSKFMFKKVVLHQLNEIAYVNPENEGSTYLGVNYDPTTKIPIGNGGVDAMAAWYKNHVVVPLRRGTATLNCELKLEAQIPLFIQKTGEVSVESQATIAAISGTSLNVGGSGSLAIGELFISFEVEFYELNPSTDDLTFGSVIMFGSGIPGNVFNTPAQYINQFIGDPNILIPFTPVGLPTESCFLMLADGVFAFECEYASSGGTAAGISSEPTLTVYLNGDENQPATGVVNSTWATDTTISPQGWNNTTFGAGSANARYVSGSGALTVLTGQQSGFASWTFNLSAGTVLLFSGPIVTSGVGSQTLNVKMTVAKVAHTYYPDGLVPVRTQSQFYTTLSQRRMIRNVTKRLAAKKPTSLSSADRFTIISWLMKNGTQEPVYSNLLIDALDLGMPKFGVTSMIPPLIAGALAWAVATFGPLVAGKVIDYIGDKLKSHMSKK